LCHTDWANHAWNSGSAGYIFLFDGWHHRSDAIDSHGTDDISTTANCGRTIDMDPTAGNIRHDGFSGHDYTGAATAGTTAPAVTFHCCNARADVIDGTGHRLHIPAGHRNHDDAIDYDDVTDRDDANGSVGDHSHANRHHHDREHLADEPAWQSLDHRMQLGAGRPADQWRGFAALDAGNSSDSATRHDSAGRRAAWRYQYRSDSGSQSNTEHVGMR